MVTAQHLNEEKFPILGAYVLGRSWFFVVLDGKQYAKSKLFDAASDASRIEGNYGALCIGGGLFPSSSAQKK